MALAMNTKRFPLSASTSADPSPTSLPAYLRAQRRLLPGEQVQELLDCSKMALHRWAIEGRIPSVKLPGGRRKYDPLALADWLESRTLQSVVRA